MIWLAWVRAEVEAAEKTIARRRRRPWWSWWGSASGTAFQRSPNWWRTWRPRGITAADVREVASHVAEATVFDLMDAVGERQPERALRLLQVVLAAEAPVKILFMLGDQIRMLLRTKALWERHPSGRRLPRMRSGMGSGTKAFLFDRYRAQVAAFGRIDVARLLGLLAETDTEIKTGSKPPRLALETLIVGLCV